MEYLIAFKASLIEMTTSYDICLDSDTCIFLQQEVETYTNSITSIQQQLKTMWIPLNHAKIQSDILTIRLESYTSQYQVFQKKMRYIIDILNRRLKVLVEYKDAISKETKRLSKQDSILNSLIQKLGQEQARFSEYVVFLLCNNYI